VRVLPLLVGDCKVPPFLRDKIYADFRDPAAYQQELDKVLTRLGAASVTGTTTIVFDESYQQERWHAQPVIGAGYGSVATAVADDYSVTSNAGGYGRVDNLAQKGILILPMPYGTLVDERHYDNLAQWVLRGGRLVLLGLYLMDLHHYSNLNHLARRF